MLLFPAVLLAVTGALGLTGNGTLPLPPTAAQESIKPEDLLSHAEFLASDELGGRYVTSPSNRIAARYLASRLRSYGYRGGAADGSFLQEIELVTRKIAPDRTFLEIRSPAGLKRFQLGADFTVVGANVSTDFQADLVYVRFGVTLPELGYDDYAHVDVKGKIAVAALATLPAVMKDGRPLTRQDYNLNRKVNNALAHGARAIILIPDAQGPAIPRGFGGLPAIEEVSIAGEEAPSQSRALTIIAGPTLADEILSETEMTRANLSSSVSAPQSKNLGKTAHLIVAYDTRQQHTQNVVGILDGSDPQLRNEFIVFSAHYDHLQSRNGQVYNGADDNASGTSAVLEIAQAFTIGERPKRSILIIFHTGEEVGLLGSKYFVTHPTVPLRSIVVNLNIDMIGRSRSPQDANPADQELSGSNTLYLIGSDKLSKELHELSEQTNKDTERFNLDYRFNSDAHPQRLYYRSDHYNYAKNGIPVIFYFTGFHQDYHRPTDDVEKLDLQKMTRITRLIFATGWRIANLDHRLKLNEAVNAQRTN